MRKFLFTVTLSGVGHTPEAAWWDAVEQFGLDPGEPETTDEITEDDDYMTDYVTDCLANQAARDGDWDEYCLITGKDPESEEE